MVAIKSFTRHCLEEQGHKVYSMPIALDVFLKIQKELKTDYLKNHRLVIKVGTHLGASVIKLLKDSWTIDDHLSIKNTTGVFFSIWVDHISKYSDLVQYNVHALKMSRLGDHKIKSRGFAESFRSQVKKQIVDWPNVSTDHGPLTLLQGSFPFSEVNLEAQCLKSMEAFVKMSPIIDQVLKPHLR